MGYRHISNLYKNKDILMFKQCYAMEKIHGTSAHVSYNAETDELRFFSGGSKHQQFLNIFDQDDLLEKFRQNSEEHPGTKKITIYGEAYAGNMQGMRDTYGNELKFIAFEVMVSDEMCMNKERWFSVPQADSFVQKMGLEFVDYKLIDTTEEAINAEMMADSVQAVRNGVGEGKMREGVVLRPLVEIIFPNGGRIICKHKRPEFSERAHTPKFSDPAQLKVLEDAKQIAEEWVNAVRLQHVLDAIGLPDPQIENANLVIAGMVEDVYREAEGEIVENKAVKKAISKQTMKFFKEYLMNKK